MDGVFAVVGVVVVVCATALVAWRWWLSDAREARTMKRDTESAVMASLPERVSALEQHVKALEWRK